MLERGTIRSAAAQLLATIMCTAVLLLFVVLSCSRISLSRYTAAMYGLKDTQQVVNLLVTMVAMVMGMLLSHCFR